MIQASGLVEHYQKDKADKGEARLENLEELVSAARGFEPEDSDMPPLAAFLSHAVLESGEGQAEAWEDCVQMMTLHSAKGLEFPRGVPVRPRGRPVPAPALDRGPAGPRGRAPPLLRRHDPRDAQLYLTYAEQRRMHGVDSYGAPSRFIAEIPPELVEEVRPRVQVSRPAYVPSRPSAPAPARWRRSQSLRRRLAGQPAARPARAAPEVRRRRGAERRGPGPNARVQVNFERQGTKWLMLGYANLEVV